MADASHLPAVRLLKSFLEPSAHGGGVFALACGTLSLSRRRHNPDARWARCPRCHATEINRIARDKVPPSWGNLIWRIVRARAYRCPECRKRFFALRPQKTQSEAVRRMDPEKGKEPSAS
jgi:predicted SprT family Zn-dependent metalloprotease